MQNFVWGFVIAQIISLFAIACTPTANMSGGPPSAKLVPTSVTLATPTVLPQRLANDPYPAGTVGYAISWPQCGGPYPDRFAFGIVGVTDGRAFTRNPCFGEEYRWAKRGRLHPSIYMNTNYLWSQQELPSWRVWCDTGLCRAYRYGWSAAQDAYAYAASFDAVAPVWWLDVQIVSDWATATDANAESIRGAAHYLASKGIRVGISSTSYQWTTVAGDAQHGLPVWDASAVDANQAATFCRDGKDFGGGRTEQIAYVATGFETVLACGGTTSASVR